MHEKPGQDIKGEKRRDADYRTAEEFIIAMRALEPTEAKRLAMQGCRLALGSPMSGNDLLGEAIRLTADGERRWPKDVKIGAYLYMSMMSVASNERRRDAQLVHVPLGGDADGRGDRLSGMADPSPSPEMRAVIADIETRAFAALADDELAQWLLLSRMERESVAEFCRRHALSASQFEAVSKRLQRKLRSLKTEHEMTTKSIDDFDRVDALCEALADAFTDASDQDLDIAMADLGLNADTVVATATSAIENALNQSLKRKLVEAGELARSGLSAHRPDLSNLTRDDLIEQLKVITANDDAAGEMLTMAARSGRGAMPVEELRSLVEDFYSIAKRNSDAD